MSKKKNEKPHYILELKLITQVHHEHKLNKRMELCRHICNSTKGYGLKQLKRMRQSKKYKNAIKRYVYFNSVGDKEKIKLIKNELASINQEFKLSKTQFESYSKEFKNKRNYDSEIDANTIQKEAEKAWKSISSLMFDGSKKVRFEKFAQHMSVEGKKNTQGIRFIKPNEEYNRKIANKHILVWNGLTIPVKIRKNDFFAQMALNDKICYCRIVRKVIKNKDVYFLQLILEGNPPAKLNSKGEFRHKQGDGLIGIDIGVSSLAAVSDIKATLIPLNNMEFSQIDKKIRRLQRKLERSRRILNPQNYNQDSTIKKGVRLKWIYSSNYINTLYEIKSLYTLKQTKRKQYHGKITNELLTQGDNAYVENMNFRGLKTRAKETTINEKTGRYNNKSRFGKQIQNFAPSALLTMYERKLGYINKPLNKINTRTFKASQLNHVTGEYTKKKLHERWNYIGNLKIQRDMYSAFLLQNSNADLKIANIEKCTEKFENFVLLHDKEIDRIKKLKVKNLSSFGF